MDDDVNRESVSCWGMCDLTATRAGTITIYATYDGEPVQYTHEYPEDVMPMVVVTYKNRGILALMGDPRDGIVRERHWQPFQEGATPPRDAFTTGVEFNAMSIVPQNTTRH